MGVEYAIVCDTTKEAYELGKGFGWQWASAKDSPYDDYQWPPPSRGEVRRVVAEVFTDETDAYVAAVTDEVWSFIQAHPGCRIISDTGDDLWHVEPTEDHRRNWERVYREVRTRYDVPGYGMSSHQQREEP